MPISFEHIKPALPSLLTEDERTNGVVYAVANPVKAGTRLALPGLTLTIDRDTFLAFVDRQPLANWGHPARYILIEGDTGDTRSEETRLPPFQAGSSLVWQLVYKAPTVPDNVIHCPS
jgi:hypothetical protein